MAYFNKKRLSKGQSRTIIVVDNNINKAISQLKHAVAPILKELKDKRYFEKPAEKRRRKQKEALRNMRKRQRLLADQW